MYGEQSLYVSVHNAGLGSGTGCGHQGIIQFAETARHRSRDPVYLSNGDTIEPAEVKTTAAGA